MTAPDLGTHFASLNLFRESDGSFRITVAGMSHQALAYADEQEVRPPVAALARPIIDAAARFSIDWGKAGTDGKREL